MKIRARSIQSENGHFLFDHLLHSAMCFTVLWSQEERGFLLLLLLLLCMHWKEVQSQLRAWEKWYGSLVLHVEQESGEKEMSVQTKRAKATAGSWAGARCECCVDTESIKRCVKGRQDNQMCHSRPKRTQQLRQVRRKGSDDLSPRLSSTIHFPCGI